MLVLRAFFVFGASKRILARSLQLDSRVPLVWQTQWRSVMRRFACVTPLTVLSFLIFVNFVSAQPGSIYRLPAGTRIGLKMDAEINSRVSSVNDTFIAVVAKPVVVRDTVVLAEGAIIEGRVRRVSRSGVAGENGRLEVVFETLKLANGSRRIEGVMATRIVEASSRRFTMLSILGGAAAGAAIGAASRSGSGTLIGAAAGAGAGTGIALLRKGRNVRIKKGAEFEIELTREVVLPVSDY